MQGRVGFINLNDGTGLEDLTKALNEALEKSSKAMEESMLPPPPVPEIE